MLQKPHSQTTMVENYTDHNISTKLRNDSYKAPTHYTVSKRFWDLSFTWHFIGCQPRDHSRVGINHIHYECNRNKAEIPRISRTGQRRLQDIVRERRFRFAGHVTRMAPECPAHCAIEWTPADGRRKRDRPKKTWRSTFREDLQARGVSWSE